MKDLTLKDEMMLLSILRLGDNAYLVSLRKLLNKTTGKEWSIGNIFVSLEKLEKLEFIKFRIGEPTDKRGGKGIKYYSVTNDGMEALKATKTVQDEMWEGLQGLIFDN